MDLAAGVRKPGDVLLSSTTEVQDGSRQSRLFSDIVNVPVLPAVLLVWRKVLGAPLIVHEVPPHSALRTSWGEGRQPSGM